MGPYRGEEAGKVILIIGTLDTKECEGYYLRDQVEGYGNRPLLMDVSMKRYRPKLGKPDISNSEVAESAGTTIEEVSVMDRAPASNVMCEGATKVVEQLYNRGNIDGVIGYGGAVGTSIVSGVLKALPLGVPKVVVSTQHVGKVVGFTLGTECFTIMSP